MLFEINFTEDGDIYFNKYKNKEDWIKERLGDLEGTDTTVEEFIGEYFTDNDKIEPGYCEGRLLIEGEIIVPKIKEKVKEIDL